MMNGGWGVWALGASIMVGFWALVFWLIMSRVRGGSANTGPEVPSAQDVLAERFARGEIDEDEFEQRDDALRRGSRPRT